MISALRAADFGFLLTVKCLVDSGMWPAMAFSEDLFRYWHSKGSIPDEEFCAVKKSG